MNKEKGSYEEVHQPQTRVSARGHMKTGMVAATVGQRHIQIFQKIIYLRLLQTFDICKYIV